LQLGFKPSCAETEVTISLRLGLIEVGWFDQMYLIALGCDKLQVWRSNMG
jgi:hypothetical protein